MLASVLYFVSAAGSSGSGVLSAQGIQLHAVHNSTTPTSPMKLRCRRIRCRQIAYLHVENAMVLIGILRAGGRLIRLECLCAFAMTCEDVTLEFGDVGTESRTTYFAQCFERFVRFAELYLQSREAYARDVAQQVVFCIRQSRFEPLRRLGVVVDGDSIVRAVEQREDAIGRSSVFRVQLRERGIAIGRRRCRRYSQLHVVLIQR